MAGGEIQIKRTENLTNGQVTYSERRNALFRKAHKLSVLCDVCALTKPWISFSDDRDSDSFFFFFGCRTKQLLDLYQKTTKIDLWSSQYERMQENLIFLKEDNRKLQRQISQRKGQCLEDLNFEELYNLEQEMENAARFIRERKFKTMSNQIDLTTTKFKRARQEQIASLADVGAVADAIDGVVDNGGVYDYRVHHINALVQLPNQPNHEDQTKSCLTSDSSVAPQNLDGGTESVCTPCLSLNQHVSTMSEDIQI